jgi:phosphohistidine phosphatase
MKRLSLLRHAKSSWAERDANDLDRPLNERGWNAARRVGKELKRRDIRFDLVLASIAARVRETIDGIEEAFDFRCEIRFVPELYLASAETLLSIVRTLPESVRSCLLVGHNPGIHTFGVDLTRDDDQGFRRRIAAKYPTGTLTMIDLPAPTWHAVTPGSGDIAELIAPKDLD